MEKELDTKETKLQTIQRQILDGRRVELFNSEKSTTLVRIRYNNLDTDGTQKWRVITGDDEYYTSEVKINCPTRTATETFEMVGEKHHIVCDAIMIVFEKKIATIN